MLKSFFLPESIWQLIRNNVLIYCFKVASLIEAFLNYSQNLSRFFTVQLSMFFASFQTTACLLYLIKSVLSRTFFIFLKVFSIGFVRFVHCLKRDNSDILSCVVLFVNNFFILFWKIFQNLVARCKNMSCLAVSLTIIAPVSSSVNSFFTKISLYIEIPLAYIFYSY